MKSTRTQAIVLRRTNYGEADRILQLLTPLGRKSAIARGVRREKSRLAGGIELFALTDVVIGEGKGDLGIITSARLTTFYRHIMQDYDRMQCGYEVIRLVGKGSDAVDEPEWFDLLHEALEGLDDVSVPLLLVQTWFYARLAIVSGNELSLYSDTAGQPLQEAAQYIYDYHERGLRRAENGSIGVGHIKLLRIIAAKPLKVVAQIGGLTVILPECLAVARRHVNA